MASIQLRYLGHATFALDLDGNQIFTDPVLTQHVAFLRRHSSPVSQAWLKSLDLILISHGHLDHYHAPSLKLLDRKTQCLVAPGLKPKLQKLGFNQVVELPVGKTYPFRNLKVKAVFANHKARFLPGGKAVSGCIGFLIKGSKNVYFPGDTDLFPEMVKLAKVKIDLMFVPIWGWAIDGHGLHLNPQKAAQALALIKPQMAIPYHWGTFLPVAFKPFFGKFLLRPVDLFQIHAQQLAPHVPLTIVPPGHQIHLP